MKQRPCWCPKPVLWELNSFLIQTLSFVLINLHRCWPRKWKHSIARLQISAQKPVLISCRVARTYVSFSDRRVSYRFLTSLTIGLIFTRVWRLGAVACHNSQKGVGEDHLQWKISLTFKAIFWAKKSFEIIPSRPAGFPASSDHCRCNAAYSAF